MIFVTVGAQIPFNRLSKTVDRWSRERGRDDVFAQIGRTGWRPSHMKWTQFLQPNEFQEYVKKASAIVAHAGMGSILTALECGKSILVMPRRGDLKETRNDHQIATAKRFLLQGRIDVAFDESELYKKLDQLESIVSKDRISTHASTELLSAIEAFIQGDDVVFQSRRRE